MNGRRAKLLRKHAVAVAPRLPNHPQIYKLMKRAYNAGGYPAVEALITFCTEKEQLLRKRAAKKYPKWALLGNRGKTNLAKRDKTNIKISWFRRVINFLKNLVRW